MSWKDFLFLTKFKCSHLRAYLCRVESNGWDQPMLQSNYEITAQHQTDATELGRVTKGH